LKNTKIFVFSAFALISAVILRTIQLLFLTDSVTGFYKEGLEALGTSLMVVIVLVIAISSFLIFLFEKQKVSAMPSNSILLGCSALFAGLANLFEIFFNQASLSTVPAFLLGLRVILILASAVVLCWFGISILFGKSIRPAFSIVLVVTWVIRLMSSFICFTGMSNISENLYDVLMLISTLVFFLFFGKAICKISNSSTNRGVIATGIAAVLFTAVSSIPCLIAYMAGDFAFVHVPIDSPVTGLFMTFFISVYLVDICKIKSEK
jgi:hypothetical protein